MHAFFIMNEMIENVLFSLLNLAFVPKLTEGVMCW